MTSHPRDTFYQNLDPGKNIYSLCPHSQMILLAFIPLIEITRREFPQMLTSLPTHFSTSISL